MATAVLTRRTGPAATGARPTATAAQLERIDALHGASLARFCLSLTRGNWTRAEEIKQETLVRAWKNPDAMANREYEGFRPWLFTVAKRISIDLERARRARPQECDESVLTLLPEPDCGYERVLDVDMVREAVGSLPVQQRAVIHCLHFRSMTAAEAAEELGIPLGTVKSRAYYALRTLRKTLTAYGYHG